ncbi:hypothetical protein LTR95_011711 [Oleoguttula sp. CCFEE 5521]
MLSPLPDSSALEAGIIEDSRRASTRLSRVQDNVRNLLRNSVFGSVHSSPQTSPTSTPVHTHASPRPAQKPTPIIIEQPIAISPSAYSCSTASLPDAESPVPGVLFPAMSYGQALQCMAHQSNMFNTRAMTALRHPDMNDPSLALFLQHKAQKRQQHAWKKSKRSSRRGRVGSTQWLLCLLLGFLLTGLLGTYLALATISFNVTPTMHILFILSILLVSILFTHLLIRICFFTATTKKKHAVYIEPVHPSRRRRRPHRTQPLGPISEDTEHLVPPTPFNVHMLSDDILADTSEAQPSAAVHQTPDVWDPAKGPVTQPPPAYGKWRGSTRADPELLHWRVLPSPTDTVPSPTYEEVVREDGNGPPSYRTRGTPERRAAQVEAEVEVEGPEEGRRVEMFEVRGGGTDL